MCMGVPQLYFDGRCQGKEAMGSWVSSCPIICSCGRDACHRCVSSDMLGQVGTCKGESSESEVNGHLESLLLDFLGQAQKAHPHYLLHLVDHEDLSQKKIKTFTS